MPLGVSGAGLLRAGYKGAAKLLAKPEPLANVSDLAEHGEKGFDALQKRATKLYDARKNEAETLYDQAFDTARAAQARGVPFAASKEGQTLLSELEREKSVLAGGKEFARGEEKIAGINRLINAIKGTTTGGFKRVEKPLGKGRMFVEEGTAPKTTEKDVEAIVEELRFLRDVDAKGKPYEAYASLDAQYKRDLSNRLEKALYSWNDDYRKADEAYKVASRKLDPFRTQLMSNALKGEKFNPKELVKSPEEFGRTFFSDKGSVQNLKQVMNDDAQVAQLGKEYVSAILSNKTPAEVKKWAFDPANVGWLKEAGILAPVQNYATKATSVAKKQKILSLLAGTAAASALGTGLASKAKQLFGGP